MSNYIIHFFPYIKSLKLYQKKAKKAKIFIFYAFNLKPDLSIRIVINIKIYLKLIKLSA